jgi:hypothetical protein
MIRLATCGFALWLGLAASARAELPSPRLDRLFPLGASAGSTVEVEVQGADLDDARTLLFDHPGLRAEFVKDRVFRVTLARDVPAGTYDARVVGRWGVSNPRLLAVTHGLAEVAEKEPNDTIEQAQAVPTNCAVNGISDNGRDDIFRVAVKKGQRVVIECQAQKLDSPLDATLTLTDAAGRQLAANSDWYGCDPLLDFTAPTDSDYFVNVHDLSYRGGQPYRLVITDRPRVENVFPRAVQAGRPVALTAFGRNFGPAGKPSAWRLQDQPLEEVPFTVTAPPDILGLGAYRFVEHPTTHSVLPTAATCTLTGFQAQPRIGEALADPVPLLVVDTPVTTEAESNDTPETAQKLTLPAVVSGRFDRERDADWYEFTPDAGGPYSLEVYCERIGGRADPYLVVVDDKGNRVTELDDYGHRVNAFDGHLRDPSGVVNLGGKRTYRVLVQDRYRRGGARYQYVLSIREAVPDFYVAAIHSQNPGPGGTTIHRGGAAYLDVIVHYQDGYNGPVIITAEGLPKGLHAAPTFIRGNTSAAVVLWADADAPDWVGPVKLIASGRRGDLALRREVRPYSRVWNSPDQNSSRPTRELVVAVRESAPFALQFATERMEIEVGKKAEVTLKVDRRWPDFTAALTVQALAAPGPVKFSDTQVPAGKNEVTLPIQVQAGAAPGEYTLVVRGQGQVPFAKDGKAAKANSLVALPARPLTVVVRPAGK